MKYALAIFSFGLMLIGSAHADTFVFDAREDFDSLNEGTVPYYKDNPRDALAINAAIEEYREVFARASTAFAGDAGKYDVTITALGEIDGNCEYRFLVNGVVVGTAVNQPTDVDYAEQEHTFTGISIPPGAQISVESNALTNGLIPEGDGTAFARGRWRTLTLVSAPVTDTVLDLAISASVPNSTPTVNEDYALTLTVTNNSADETATNPLINFALPADTTVADDGTCTIDNATVTCALAEIAPQASASINLTANTTTQSTVTFAASISADQTDSDSGNDTATSQVTVGSAIPDSVDLALSVSSDVDVVNAGQSVALQLTVVNKHQQTTATAPVTGAALPAGLTFAGSSDCTAEGQTVTCNLAELAPNQTTSAAFTATATMAGSASVVVSVSANEPETSVADNEVVHTVTVVENRSNPDSTTTDTLQNSGGGSFGIALWWLLLLPFAGLGLRNKLPQQYSR